MFVRSIASGRPGVTGLHAQQHVVAVVVGERVCRTRHGTAAYRVSAVHSNWTCRATPTTAPSTDSGVAGMHGGRAVSPVEVVCNTPKDAVIVQCLSTKDARAAPVVTRLAERHDRATLKCTAQSTDTTASGPTSPNAHTSAEVVRKQGPGCARIPNTTVPHAQTSARRRTQYLVTTIYVMRRECLVDARERVRRCHAKKVEVSSTSVNNMMSTTGEMRWQYVGRPWSTGGTTTAGHQTVRQR